MLLPHNTDSLAEGLQISQRPVYPAHAALETHVELNSCLICAPALCRCRTS